MKGKAELAMVGMGLELSPTIEQYKKQGKFFSIF